MTMLTKIDGSLGIKIPQNVAEQVNLKDCEIEFKVTKDGLLLRPVRKDIRNNWKEDIEKKLKGDDTLHEMLDDSDLDEWEW